jgi:sugar lactone lactonase YvrE
VIDTYSLPSGTPDIMPEGIATQPGGTFYVSSARHGTIYRGHVGTPTLEVWQPAGIDGRTQALGLTVDPHGRLLVCGWETGHLFAYDTATGALSARVTVPAEVTGLNDICILDGYAYSTDSKRPVIWRLAVDGEVGPVEELIDLGPFGAPDPEDCFLNGIVPGPTPGTLIVADQAEEVLWRVDVVTGTAERVDLGGSHVAGDGLVWVDDVLYACDNSETDGAIQMWLTALQLPADGRKATIIGRWERPVADTPTTAAYVDGRLLLVNSQMLAERTGQPLREPFTVSAVSPPHI